MANRNTTGFGLIPQGTVGSTMASQGQGKYYIAAAYGQDLFQGCSVKAVTGIKKIVAQIRIEAVTFSFFFLLIFNVNNPPIT